MLSLASIWGDWVTPMWRDAVLTLYMGRLGNPHVEGCCPCIWGDWVSPMWRDAVLTLYMGDWVTPMWRDAVLVYGRLGNPHVEGCCPYLVYGATG